MAGAVSVGNGKVGVGVGVADGTSSISVIGVGDAVVVGNIGVAVDEIDTTLWGDTPPQSMISRGPVSWVDVLITNASPCWLR